MPFDVQPPLFLLSALTHLEHQPPPDNRPHVTLTFAQSLDAKIAAHQGKQLILSGKESMLMTHWMRSMHDGIMIGIGTALNDDPQLNTRHLPPRLDGQPHSLPRPIILDTHLRLSPACKLLINSQAKTGRQPWVVCAAPKDEDRSRWQQRCDILTQAGAVIIQVQSATGALPIPAVLQKLRSLGINSLMVEGGARVIDSFLLTSLSAAPLMDSLIVTVAPTLVGTQGVGYGIAFNQMSRVQSCDAQIVGKDVVMILKVLNTKSE